MATLLPEKPRGMGRINQFFVQCQHGPPCRLYQNSYRGEWSVSLRGGSLLNVSQEEVLWLRELADMMEKFMEVKPIDFQI